MARFVSLVVLLAALSAAPAEAKTKAVYWQQNAGATMRFWDQLGFITVNGIQPQGAPLDTVKAGGITYKVAWINATYSRGTTTEGLRELHRDSRYPPVSRGFFADRRLTATERRRFDVLVDLARDGDVLVVHRDNPVCASGLTLAQARGIARGAITRWSQVATLPAGQPDAIVQRLIGTGAYAQPRFGAPEKPGTKPVMRDGGVSLIAGGNRAVAAVTGWTQVRNDSRLCAVPINGIAPTDATVHALEYPAAYPISYVMHRKRRRDREGRALVRGFVRFLRSERAAKMFRGAGVLLVNDPVSATPQGGGGVSGPSGDYQGRPITTTQDDAAARAALDGQRLQLDEQRLVFDPASALRELTISSADGSCAPRAEGTWEVLIGWRYPEYGGGVTAVVRLTLDTVREVTIQLPNDDPGTAYVNGAPYARDRSLPGSCG